MVFIVGIVNIFLKFLQVVVQRAVIFFINVNEVRNVAVMVDRSVRTLVRSVDAGDSLEKVLRMGSAKQIHLLQTADIVARRKHVFHDEQVWLVRGLKLCLIVLIGFFLHWIAFI